MKIQLNGSTKDISRPENLSNIIAQFCKQTKNVIAEVNGEIVPSAQWSEKTIAEGDTIELVSFVGGG